MVKETVARKTEEQILGEINAFKERGFEVDVFRNPNGVLEGWHIVGPKDGRIYDPDDLRFGICSFCVPGEDFDPNSEDEKDDVCPGFHDDALLAEEEEARKLAELLDQLGGPEFL